MRLFCTPSKRSRRRVATADTANAREERIDLDGVPIATYIWGDPQRQPYLLFAHGWSSHGTRIAAWVAPLREAGYALIAFDQPAHGRSGGEIVTLPDFACCLLAVGQYYGPAAAVIGHSLGGAATAIALARGLEAERVILIAPAADPCAAIERFARFVWLGAWLANPLSALLERATKVPMYELQAHRNAPLIGRPALIVHDLEDREVPWSEGERYARLWPGARMLTTRGLGHNRITDHPGVIIDALLFLRDKPIGERIVSSPNLPYGFA